MPDMKKPAGLPIHDVETQIIAAVSSPGALVLTAPTGSGKTTQVPQMLLHAGIEGRILVLQPRRLAARIVARRVADELDCGLGGLVGYQTRHERHISHATRILFLTEGLFLRQLLADPKLTGVGAVVLDEFHERNLAVDLALGLCRRLRAGARNAGTSLFRNCERHDDDGADTTTSYSAGSTIVSVENALQTICRGQL